MADASHELRTPLAIVLAQADLALKRPRTNDEYFDTIRAVRRAAERMKDIVEGLLTLARADGGDLRLNQDRFDMKDVVEQTCRMLAPLAASRSIEIAMQLESAPVCGDRNRLGEAVANIVNNAIQYNEPGGRVDVTLEAVRGDVTLCVADTGLGIPRRREGPGLQPFLSQRSGTPLFGQR